MYLMGGLDRYIDRYIGRYSIEYRSNNTRSSIDRCIGRVSTDSPLNDTHGVGRHIDRDTVSGISVSYRLYIVRLSVKSRSILDRVSIDIRSISC